MGVGLERVGLEGGDLNLGPNDVGLNGVGLNGVGLSDVGPDDVGLNGVGMGTWCMVIDPPPPGRKADGRSVDGKTKRKKDEICWAKKEEKSRMKKMKLLGQKSPKKKIKSRDDLERLSDAQRPGKKVLHLSPFVLSFCLCAFFPSYFLFRQFICERSQILIY